MATLRTLLKPECMYHVWTHANGSENLFRSDKNYHFFLTKYGEHLAPVVETYAYCLMPNHLHLMIRVRSKEELSTLPGFESLEGERISKAVSQRFSNLFNGYTQAYNREYERMGGLFIDSFHRKLIDTEDYFTALIIYIHNNPVHHGFVTNPNDWTYSSFHSYLLNKESVMDKVLKIKNKEGVEWFGSVGEMKKAHEGVRLEWLSNVLE